MASEDNLLSKITALVAGFDDASWEALASKGLLRRARKDLEKGLELEVLNDIDDALQIMVPPFVISMPASGPAKASCTCPAPGFCQHILAAGLYLQSKAPENSEERVSTSADSIREEISLLTTERLKTSFGAADYRAGVALLEKNTAPAVIEYLDAVIIRLMPGGIEVRFVPGGGLDGMISPKPHGRRAAVAALLALRKSLGLEVPAVFTQQALIELTGTPRTKKEILDSACSVLESALAVGLSHASPILTERLVTLAVSAQGANLPRVSLALKTVADEVKSILEREARADEGQLLLLMARLYALMKAIAADSNSPHLELAGTQRAQYVEVAEIDLSGVGAYTWQSGSGYCGLTVLFWSNQTKEFLSWSETRPATQQFDPRQRFYGEGPWEGAQSPQQVAASNLKLRNARRTANGRLSSSTKTSALVLAATTPQALELGGKLFASWEVLRRDLCQRQGLGLRESNPLDLICVLQPKAYGARGFDSVTQTFSWEVYDEMDQALTLSLPFRDWSKESIRILEELTPPEERRWRFVVRLAARDDQLIVEPISILRQENSESPIFNLSFDALPVPAGPSIATSTIEEDRESSGEGASPQYEEEVETEISERMAPTSASLYRVITELNRRLEAIAETGVENGLRAHRTSFAQSQREVHALGLTALAGVLDSLSQSAPEATGVLLKARFLTHLHSQAVARLS